MRPGSQSPGLSSGCAARPQSRGSVRRLERKIGHRRTYLVGVDLALVYFGPGCVTSDAERGYPNIATARDICKIGRCSWAAKRPKPILARRHENAEVSKSPTRRHAGRQGTGWAISRSTQLDSKSVGSKTRKGAGRRARGRAERGGRTKAGSEGQRRTDNRGGEGGGEGGQEARQKKEGRQGK